MLIIALALGMTFFGCDKDSGGEEGGPFGPLRDPVKTITFTESAYWQEGPDNGRWNYDKHRYDTTDEGEDIFDMPGMLEQEKVVVFSYSFSSSINIDLFQVYFSGWESEIGWKNITNYAIIKTNIIRGTEYSGKIVLIPNDNAALYDVSQITLTIEAKNRNVPNAVTVYFYEYNWEIIDKETGGSNTWTVSDKEFTITEGTFAKIETSYQNKSNVLHIKPSYGVDNYNDFVIQYDLNAYKGQKIKIVMSMDVWLNKKARIAWQINSSPTPFYPIVCGVGAPDAAHPDPKSGPAMSANTWLNITTGTEGFIYTVPNTPPYTEDGGDDNGKQLYLSGLQIDGAEAYFANASITITVVP